MLGHKSRGKYLKGLNKKTDSHKLHVKGSFKVITPDKLYTVEESRAFVEILRIEPQEATIPERFP